MKAIIAVNNLGYIGKDNEIPWNSRDDLIHFRKMTEGSTCIVGYNTAKKLPQLPGRKVEIDSREMMLYNSGEWCIGGKKTYEKYCHLFTELHISHINDSTVGDIMFPNLKKLPDNCKVFNYYFECSSSNRISLHKEQSQLG